MDSPDKNKSKLKADPGTEISAKERLKSFIEKADKEKRDRTEQLLINRIGGEERLKSLKATQKRRFPEKVLAY